MLTEFQAKKWTHLFNIYDVDGNGLVGKVDFEIRAAEVASLYGIAPGTPEYAALLDRVLAYWRQLLSTEDKDDSQTITLEEWLEYGDRIVNDDAMYAAVKEQIETIFSRMDRDRDGIINREEFIGVVTGWGVTREAVESVFPRLDVNGNGTLSRDEFRTLLQQFHKSDDPSEPGNYFFGPL